MSDNNLPGRERVRKMGALYEVELDYNIRYILRVYAGHDRDDVIQAAEDTRFVEEPAPVTRDLVHTNIEEIEPVYEDEEAAKIIAPWLENDDNENTGSDRS